MRKHLMLIFVFATFLYSQKRPISTYSIVAYDEKTGEMGVAVQSHWFSVGSVVPWAKAGVGAVATQSFVKIEYGPDGLELMEKGLTAQEALDSLVSRDTSSAVRQVGMVDVNGVVAVHTGEKCIEFAGHKTGKGFTVQANIMASPTVWPLMAMTFEQTEGDLAERMMATLEAAQAEGGDLRGKQSASMLVVSGTPTGVSWKDVVLDLRVEDHPEPLKQLRRLIRINRAYRHANTGDHYMETGDIKSALVEYDLSSKLYPENPELKYWAAVTLVGEGRLKEALPMFGEVFKRAPELKIMTPRLVPPGLLPNENKILDQIMNTEQ
jgi:uncharacterized Ntn-hydrolase superfamily protein